MNFRVNSLQPVAAAAGVSSRVQLPAAGQVVIKLPGIVGRRTMPQMAAHASRQQPRGHMGQYRSRHRAECRAACMSKANF
ncbi:hypothetical protein [Hymenobacter daeguensis]